MFVVLCSSLISKNISNQRSCGDFFFLRGDVFLKGKKGKPKFLYLLKDIHPRIAIWPDAIMELLLLFAFWLCVQGAATKGDFSPEVRMPVRLRQYTMDILLRYDINCHLWHVLRYDKFICMKFRYFQLICHLVALSFYCFIIYILWMLIKLWND